MKNKIKNWIKDMFDFGMDTDCDVNVDIARANYKKHQERYLNELEQKKKDYIETLCDEIKFASKNGCKSIETVSSLYDFMTYEFLMEIKEYFKQRGFSVIEESSDIGCHAQKLRIKW